MRDKTPALTRLLRSQLEPGERVLAGVAVALSGTGAAALSSAASVATGVHSLPSGTDSMAAGRKQARRLGIEKGHQFYLVLTSIRVVVIRRSIFGRAKEVVLQAPLADVTELGTPKGGSKVYIGLAGGRRLGLEPPKAPKFLPPVYKQLSSRFADAKAQAEHQESQPGI